MPRPIHFEIPADRPERAIAFYEQVFGWRFQKWEGPTPYWLVQTGADGPGIDGGLLARCAEASEICLRECSGGSRPETGLTNATTGTDARYH